MLTFYVYVLIAPSRAGCCLRELLSFFNFLLACINLWLFFFNYLVCDVSYLKEPFPSVQCNPYSASSMFSLQCQVQAPAPVIPRLEILWFFTNTSVDTVQISAATLTSFRSIENETGMSGQLLTSTINFGRFTNPIHAGGYFCRVALDGNTASFSASTVQTYTVETDTILNENPCGGANVHTRSVMMICAGNISDSTTSGQVTESSTAIQQPTSAIISSTPLPSSLPSLPPTSDASLGGSVGGTTISQPQTGRPALSLWVYVLVGVAAVFAMIIIVLTILCIGLCLKKNKTTDSFKREFSLVSLNNKE